MNIYMTAFAALLLSVPVLGDYGRRAELIRIWTAHAAR